MRFGFAGTPDFGACVLRDLLERGRRPELVISQPTRPRGRGRKMVDSPVAVVAADEALPLLTPADINSAEILEEISASRIDCLVVAAFGQLFKQNLLDCVPCINVHASLLPYYRGAAPIHWALRNGETQTGVSVMRVIPALDAGPVAARVCMSISLRDDAGSIGRALALLGALATDQVLQGLEDGTVRWEEQPAESTYAPKVSAGDRRLNLSASSLECHNLVRSLVPDSAAEVWKADTVLRVWRTWPWMEPSRDDVPTEARTAWGEPGRVATSRHRGGRLFFGCGEGLLEILAVQPAGRRVMSAGDFLRGYGSRLPEFFDLPSAP